MPAIGAPELLILLVFLLAIVLPLLVGLMALIDIARRPDSDFVAAGQSHTTWLIIAIASLVVPCMWLGSAYYLAGVRPKLATRS